MDLKLTGLMECPHCTAQREARLKAELLTGELILALARSIKDQLAGGPETFQRLAGISLPDYIKARRKSVTSPSEVRETQGSE